MYGIMNLLKDKSSGHFVVLTTEQPNYLKFYAQSNLVRYMRCDALGFWVTGIQNFEVFTNAQITNVPCRDCRRLIGDEYAYE